MHSLGILAIYLVVDGRASAVVIGSLGESVDSTRRFIPSLLTSAASSDQCDATEKKGHINCDVLDVPIEAMAGCMTGRGC